MSKQASRIGKKGVMTYMEAGLAETVKLVATSKGLSMQDYLIGLIQKDIKENDVKQQVVATINQAMKQITTRNIAPSRSVSPRHHATRPHAHPRS